MSKHILNKGTLFWLMASAGLVGVITLQMKDDPWLAQPVTAATIEPYQAQTHDQNDFSASSLNVEWLDRIAERPLFSASRQPFSPTVEQPTVNVEPAIDTLAVTLAGTLLAGESRVALLVHPTDGLLRLRQGQKVDGWRIDEIHEDRVRLRRGSKVTQLSLRKGAFQDIHQPTAGNLGRRLMLA